MTTKSLLIVTAVIEVATGLALMAVPSFAAHLLLGEGLISPQAVLVARVAGAALISVGVMCWLGRNGERPTQLALVAGMLIYNLAVPAVLIHGWFGYELHGVGLWPASLLHAALAVWCVASLRPVR